MKTKKNLKRHKPMICGVRPAAIGAVLACLLLLAACGKANDTTAGARALETTAPQTEIQTQAPDEAAVPQQPTGNETDRIWQDAYIAVLNSARVHNFEQDAVIAENDAVSYSLYDIDKDDIPELFLQIGDVEASRSVRLYRCVDGLPVLVSEFYNGHSSFDSCPDENGVVLYWGHMGDAYVSMCRLVDGELMVEELFSETIGPDEWYTDIREYVPGSMPLDNYDIDIDLPILSYRVVQRYISGHVSQPAEKNADAKETLWNVLCNDGEIYGASANRFGNETGFVTLSEYLQPGMAERYASEALQVAQYAWADMDNDGQTECILRLVRDVNDPYSSSDTLVVLSLQGKIVYAYPLTYFSGIVLESGALALTAYEPEGDASFEGYERILFHGNECFTFRVPDVDSVKEVFWETYSKAPSNV